MIIDDVAAFIKRYVSFPNEHALVAVALWVAHAHVVDAFDSSPRLALLSPEPGSGKTRTLEVIELLVPRPMHALNASAAPIYRSIETARPTLLFDEVDALFGKRGKDESAEDLRAIVNAGHRKGARVPRCVGPQHDVRLFPVYCAVALAGLGDLPDTVMSRSLIIRMRRRAPDEYVQPFRRRLAAPEGETLEGELASWAESAAKDLADAWPEMPDGVTDRPADVWEGLLAIADAIGDHWPKTARAACIELCKVSESREASLGVKLLTDLRVAFNGVNEALSTEAILERLHRMPESPWSDLRGRPLDARGLARRLVAYGVSPTKVKVDGASLRGYRREPLWDAWQRYLPPPGEAEPAEPSEPTTSGSVSEVPLDFEVPEPANENGTSTPGVTGAVPEVPQVPDLQGERALTALLDAERVPEDEIF